MKVSILASGSSGNATLFESGGTRVLVDAGLAPSALMERLAAAGTPGALDAVVVTHAHRDHVGHAAALAARFGVAVYVTESTARIARLNGATGVRVYGPRTPFAVGALTVSPTPLPHDVAQVALVLSDGTRSAAIATDLGEVPPALPEALAQCDVLLIESNHDLELLRRGPYPQFLKKRILSARGHLSNLQTHALLRALPAATHTVVLMHLSRTNNREDVALACASDALAGRHVRLLAARQEGMTLVDAAAPPPADVVAAIATPAYAPPVDPPPPPGPRRAAPRSNQRQLSLRF